MAIFQAVSYYAPDGARRIQTVWCYAGEEDVVERMVASGHDYRGGHEVEVFNYDSDALLRAGWQRREHFWICPEHAEQ